MESTTSQKAKPSQFTLSHPITLRFLRPYGVWQTHERAGFNVAEAAELVSRGIATYVVPDQGQRMAKIAEDQRAALKATRKAAADEAEAQVTEARTELARARAALEQAVEGHRSRQGPAERVAAAEQALAEAESRANQARDSYLNV